MRKALLRGITLETIYRMNWRIERIKVEIT